MTTSSRMKKVIRARMAETGENYTAARREVAQWAIPGAAWR